MSFIDIEITHNGNNKTSEVISYNREHYICSGVATLIVELIDDGTNYDPWDEVVLYEEGTKKGTFYIREVIRGIGSLKIDCQDNSLKLVEYFTDPMVSFPYITYARFWIEKYLDEAGVNYTFLTTENGAPINVDATFGRTSAYEIIVQMMQMSNWYMYFNPNGNCIIGSLTLNTGSPDARVDDDTILDIKLNTNDKMLRNRAVVWGGADLVYNNWIYVDLSVHTTWNYDEIDKRVVVLSNNTIQTYYDANRIARQILTEFARITEEKTVTVTGELNVAIGDYIFINSDFFSGGGMLTTVASQMDSSGFVTILTLDQRCPRLFAFIGNYTDYVYIGTTASGIHRKPLETSGWYDYSTGLTDLGITDLSINSGIFATTTSSGYLFYKTLYTNWNLYSPDANYFAPSGSTVASGIVTLSGITPSGYYASCCALDKMDYTIYAAFVTNSGVISSGYIMSGALNEFSASGESWIVQIDSFGRFIRSDKVVFTLDNTLMEKVTVIDMDNNGTENILICQSIAPYEMIPSGVLFNQGYYKNFLSPALYLGSPKNNTRELDTHVFSIGPQEASTHIPDEIEVLGLAMQFPNTPIIVFGDEKVAFFKLSSFELYEVHMNEAADDFVEDVWSIPDVGDYSTNYEVEALFRESDETYTLALYRDLSDIRYFKILSISKSGNVSLIDDTASLPFTGVNSNRVKLGELVVSFDSVGYTFQDGDSDDHRGVRYSFGAYNLRNGYFYPYDVYFDDTDTPKLRYGADIKHEQYPIFLQDSFGNPVLYLVSVGTMERFFDNNTCQSIIDQKMWILTIFSSMATDFRVVDTLFSVDHVPCSQSLSIAYYGGMITGYSLNKWNARFEYKVGWTLEGESEQIRIVNLALPTLIDVGNNFPSVTVEIPLAARTGYEYIHFATETYVNDKAFLYHDDLFVCELEIPEDDVFEAPGVFTFIPAGFVTNRDANDDFIYGLVLKGSISSPSFGYTYFCGWDKYGTLKKRYFTWVQSGTSGGNTYTIYSTTMFNQFALLQYTVNSGFRYLFMRFPDPSDPLYGGLNRSTVVRQRDSEFTAIYDASLTLGVDTSKNAPTVIYHPPTSGILDMGISLLGISYTNESGSFNVMPTTFPINDVRVFDVGNVTSFIVESGTPTLEAVRYIAFVNSGGFFCIDAALSSLDILHIVTPSGAMASGIMGSGIAGSGIMASGLIKLETTNFSPTTPYFFIASPSGFWQRNPGESSFIDYSVTLPGSTITIIRTDDRL